eukprot:3982333-Prymnesium_polylepis.1
MRPAAAKRNTHVQHVLPVTRSCAPPSDLPRPLHAAWRCADAVPARRLPRGRAGPRVALPRDGAMMHSL